MSRESWKSIVHGLGLAVLVVALSAGVGFAQVADPEGDADLPCVDIVSVDVTATTTSLAVTAEMSPRPYPPEYVINGIDDPNEYRLCPGGLYEVLLDTDRDGLADEDLALFFDEEGEAIVLGPDSLEVDYSIRQGEVTWNLSLDDLALSELPATIGLRVEAEDVNDGSFLPLFGMDVEDSFPDAWQEVVVGAEASRLLGPAGGTLSVDDAGSPLFGLSMTVPPCALARPQMVGLDTTGEKDDPGWPEDMVPTCHPQFHVFPGASSWKKNPLLRETAGDECQPEFLEAFDGFSGRWRTMPYVAGEDAGAGGFVAALSRDRVESNQPADASMSFSRSRSGPQQLPCHAERGLYLAMTYLWVDHDHPALHRHLRETLSAHQVSRVLVNMGSTKNDNRGCVRWMGGNADDGNGECHQRSTYADVAGHLKDLIHELPDNVSVALWVSSPLDVGIPPEKFRGRMDLLREDTEELLACLSDPTCGPGQNGLTAEDLARIREVHFDIEPLSDYTKADSTRTYLQYVLQEVIGKLKESPHGKQLEYSLFGERLEEEGLQGNQGSHSRDVWKWSEQGLAEAVHHARVYYPLYDTWNENETEYEKEMKASLQRAEEVCHEETSKLVPAASSSDHFTETHTRAETVRAAANAVTGSTRAPKLGGFTLYIQSPTGQDGEPTAEEWAAFDSVFADCHVLFRDDFGDGLGNWILKGSPSPRWIDEIYGRQGVFDNNGDSWCDNQAGSKEVFDLSPPFTLEGEVYLSQPNPHGCWQNAFIGLGKGFTGGPSCPGFWNSRTFLDFFYVGDACWGEPPETRRKAWVHASYYGSDGELHSSPFSFRADKYLGKWVRLRIVVDENGIPSFYIEGELISRGEVPISREELVGMRVLLGRRSSGYAGKAYHDWVELKPGVDAP